MKTAMSKLFVFVIVGVSILALALAVSSPVTGQGGGISVTWTVSWISGTPTTITYTTTYTTTSLVPVAPIPGFPFESIILGIALGILTIIIVRRKKA